MSISTILYIGLAVGGVFLMMRMHGGHGGGGHGGGGHGGGGQDGGGCGGGHGSHDKNPAQPATEAKPASADEVGKAKPSRGHSGH